MTTIIDVNDLLDIPTFKEKWPQFRSVDNCAREKIEPDMEVLVMRSGEYFQVRIDSVDGETLTGKVLTEKFYFDQPFKVNDFIRFYKKNVIDIYDINRTGVLY